jgi:hypothetical protein
MSSGLFLAASATSLTYLGWETNISVNTLFEHTSGYSLISIHCKLHGSVFRSERIVVLFVVENSDGGVGGHKKAVVIHKTPSAKPLQNIIMYD